MFAEAASSLRVVVIVVDHRLFGRRRARTKTAAAPFSATTVTEPMHERFDAFEGQRASGNACGRSGGAAQEASGRAGAGCSIRWSSRILRRSLPGWLLIRHLLVLRLRRRRSQITMAKQATKEAGGTRRLRLLLSLLHLLNLRARLIQGEILDQNRLG